MNSVQISKDSLIAYNYREQALQPKTIFIGLLIHKSVLFFIID